MPKNKDAYSRYRIIDKELRKGRRVKTLQLAVICSEQLGTDIDVRTIQQDITDMKEDTGLGLFVPIQYDTYKKAFYYPPNTPPIFPAVELNEEEVNALLFYSKALSHYKNYPIFTNISQAIEKVLDGSNIPFSLREALKKRPIFEAEKNIAIKGSDYIRDIIIALIDCKKIEFDYTKFTGESKHRKVTPYLLKEDRQMWYIIGLIEGKNAPTTFALDRMNNLKITSEVFIPVDFDSEAYFKYCFGITAPDSDPIKVVISFSPEQAHYLKALKIHETQETITDDDDEFRIAIWVKPTYEFYAKILSYGSDAKIISPKKVAHTVEAYLKAALQAYKKKK